jgi:hypothetical protein
MERTYTPLNLSAAFIDKNASDYIASASYKWAPTVCQCSERYKAINCIMLFLNGVLHSQL